MEGNMTWVGPENLETGILTPIHRAQHFRLGAQALRATTVCSSSHNALADTAVSATLALLLQGGGNVQCFQSNFRQCSVRT